MKNKSFAIFILTHGRADNVVTFQTLKKVGCTAKIYFVIDNEDDQAEKYYENFGKENVIMFDKLAISKTFDTMDLSEERRTIVYARNACFDIAKDLGLEYFLELDDDYSSFMFRYEKDDTLSSVQCKNLDKVFDAMLDFLDQTGAYSVAFAQGGDFIGGATSQFWQKKIHRKVMNSFFCRTDKPFKFLGSINEDVNAYVTLGQKGKLFFTISECMLVQTATQQSKGGLTDIYLDLGTYVKSFYSVICSPSCVKVHSMGVNYMRIHHKVEADKCYPKIINEKYKKK